MPYKAPNLIETLIVACAAASKSAKVRPPLGPSCFPNGGAEGCQVNFATESIVLLSILET